MTAPASTIPAIVVRRTIEAPRERVWAAWTQREAMLRWLAPDDETTLLDAQADVRPGGTYRLTFKTSEGEVMSVGGEYREVAPPSRLVFTWQWEEDAPAVGDVTRVTVELLERGTATELVLTHDQFLDAASRDRHEHGWNLIGDSLVKHAAELQAGRP